MTVFRPEVKPTGKPLANKKLTSSQRRALEKREADEATALQQKLKADGRADEQEGGCMTDSGGAADEMRGIAKQALR